MDEPQNEIIKRWRDLEDIEEEHRLFNAYLQSRNAFLDELRSLTVGNSTRERAAQLKRDEQLAFDQYVQHRTKLQAR